MTREILERPPLRAIGLTLALALSGTLAFAQPPKAQDVPNVGQQITPTAPTGSTFQGLNPGLADYPNWLAGNAVTTVVSPDRSTLLILTSGFNRIYRAPLPPVPVGLAAWYLPDSTEYIFVYDISTTEQKLKQVVPIFYPTAPNALPYNSAYNGIAWDPSGLAFYVAGGPDDVVHIFTISASTGKWGESQNPPLPLGHNHVGLGLSATTGGLVPVNSQVSVLPCAAGVALSSDGKTMVVVNYYNDSATVFYRGLGGFASWSAGFEVDLRPGKSDPTKAGVPGGEYPFWSVVKGNGLTATAYVSSVRDREIVILNVGQSPAVIGRIPVKGQPNKMTLNGAQSLLYVAEDQSDTVDIIDTAKNAVVETIPVIATLLPSNLTKLKGANPNSVTLSPDEKQLYVTNGNLNCVSVIALGGTNSGDKVVGLIPTGWYPNSVSLNWYPFLKPYTGKEPVYMFVINAKSPSGANPDFCYGGYGPVGGPNCMTTNEYIPQLMKAGLQIFPLPDAAQLTTLTAQVALNNRFASTVSDQDKAVMAALRQQIKHVIYILKENRTYDQILGDLGIGEGDPKLTQFGQLVTPNFHSLARKFVTLDHFLDSAEISYDGWLWSTTAQSPDVVERQYPITYGYRGLSIDSEGTNRQVNVALPTVAERQKANPFTPDDPDLLAGQTDTDAPDGPGNEINTGYLWNAALRAGLTVRNYGFMLDGTRYNTPVNYIPMVRNPYQSGSIMAYPSNVALTPFTDLYFRGFDTGYPDFYRYAEWQREFDSNYSGGGLPSLSLVRFMHDHTGSWTAGANGYPPAAIDGVNTPELQVADNDYAVGMLVDKIAHSIYANDTLIFIVEDDAQDGGDHVDAHRGPAFIVGPYVKQGAVVSTHYNTIDFLRTMEEVLGLPPLNLNDALGKPMADVFNATDLTNKTPTPWSFTAVPSAYLYGTKLMLPPKPVGLVVPKSTHNAKYWGRVMKGMDFSDADRVDPVVFNRILWKGMKGNQPYPERLRP